MSDAASALSSLDHREAETTPHSAQLKQQFTFIRTHADVSSVVLGMLPVKVQKEPMASIAVFINKTGAACAALRAEQSMV